MRTGEIAQLVDTLGIEINPATREGQEDVLSNYKISDIDADASPNYYGFLRKDGAWYILKETRTTGADTYLYVKGASAFTTAWTGRVGQTYQTFDLVF